MFQENNFLLPVKNFIQKMQKYTRLKLKTRACPHDCGMHTIIKINSMSVLNIVFFLG